MHFVALEQLEHLVLDPCAYVRPRHINTFRNTHVRQLFLEGCSIRVRMTVVFLPYRERPPSSTLPTESALKTVSPLRPTL